MSELTREIIPIAVMYSFVLLLAPFVGFAMWMAFDGDRVVTMAQEAKPDAAVTEAPVATEVTKVPAQTHEALGAA